MDFEAVTKLVLENFQKMNIRYALIGGFALHVAGISRATKDIDFLVSHEDMPKVKTFLLGHGYELIHESQDVSNFWSPIQALGNIDFLHAHRHYALEMLSRSVNQEVLGGKFVVPVVRSEDIIGLKLQAAVNDPKRAPLDLMDIRGIIELNHSKLNMDLIREYFKLFDLEHVLDTILKDIKYVE